MLIRLDRIPAVLMVAAFTAVCAWSGSAAAGGGRIPAGYTELLQQSMNEKFGLQFYIKGQVIPGVVTRITDDGAVEARNPEHDRIIIRLDRVDAILH